MSPWSRYARYASQRSSLSPEKTCRDLLETHIQSLGYRQLGRMKIDCSFLPDSKWGFLGETTPGDPAWLLYLQLQVSRPDDCKLTSTTVRISFDKTDAPSIKPVCRSKPGPVLTQYYGPKKVTRSQFTSGLDGLYMVHGSKDRPEYLHESGGQRSLHASTWAVEGDDSSLHRQVEWVIKEAYTTHHNILHQDQVQVGLIIRHDSDPFFITVRIEGELQGRPGWFKFPSSTESPTKSICVRVSPSTHELTCLDDIAKDLDRDMTARILRHLRAVSGPSKRPAFNNNSETHGVTKGPQDYTIGWICALPVEMAAARAMLDEIHDPLPTPVNDRNNYILGNIGPHNIVVACLPAGVYGITSATNVVTQMIATFESIQIGLMVWIGGGVPSSKADIRLGDLVVSKLTGKLGGVVQYDSGKTIANGEFEQTGALSKPPQAVLTTAAKMQAEHMVLGNRIADHLAEMEAKYPVMQEFACPGQENDRLFKSEYDHDRAYFTCNRCDPTQCITRKPRAQSTPRIHYVIIASGSQVMKHGKTRDRISQEHGIICFEMEAAGIMDNFPCLVIRGICDYADSHKNEEWHGYAAATAAAYAKEFIAMTPVRQVEITPKLGKWAMRTTNPRTVLILADHEMNTTELEVNGASKQENWVDM
ncbi:nucleoside phosphorylase domain-containing protein [Aspergillus foveolatus]|uniref:nucleoside phosphorylase domain-containing protein n=1 Tax=Aspergillus foveolatus TaxID=210207 RepID=UPI003CCDF72B